MEAISKLFLYIPGIVVFLAGSGQVRRYIEMRRYGICAEATVKSCKHVVKKDKKGRETYNYYNVTVEYTNPKTGYVERHSMKSPTAYAEAQPVRVCGGRHGEEPVLAESEEESLFHPWVVMVGGALMILLALFENQGKEIQAMFCLSALFFGAGAAMLANFISLKRRGLKEIDAEIIDVFERQISKETKILRGSKFTYYPVVRYGIDGHDAIRRCKMNSERKQMFQTGDIIKLYIDPVSHMVLEHRARAGVAAAGAFLLVTGMVAMSGTLQAWL